MPAIFSITLSGHFTRPIAVSIAIGLRQRSSVDSVSEASQRARVKAGESKMAGRKSHTLPHKCCTTQASMPSIAANRRPTKRTPSLDITPPHRLRVLGIFIVWHLLDTNCLPRILQVDCLGPIVSQVCCRFTNSHLHVNVRFSELPVGRVC